MHVLRAEKGFIIVGQDTDGSMTPADMNMDWVVGKNKSFSFIGKRSLQRSDSVRENRKQLVGLKPWMAPRCCPRAPRLFLTPSKLFPCLCRAM